MTKEQNLVDDLLTLGSSVLGNLVNARHELKAQAKQQAEHFVRKLDLVSREEFDTAFAMLSKARALQDELADRLDVLEAKLKQSSPKSAKKQTKKSLPVVKKSARAKRRV
jgi:BMFP domain-containing protein YqiC